jgi:hypothetical protein
MARRRYRPPERASDGCPAERLFNAVHPMMTADPLTLFLEKGWSLRLHCFDCGHMVEWSPPKLIDRFPTALGVTLGELAPRMVCRAEDCGSRRIMLYPVNYPARDWVWPPADQVEAACIDA